MEHTGLLFLFTCQPTKSSNFSRSGVNVRAHLLRKNYSRNFSSIRSAPISPLSGPRREKTCLWWFANNKGADQPVIRAV